MNDPPLLFSINKITHYFKKWTTGSSILKKNLSSLPKRDVQKDPLESGCSQKQQHPERTLR